MSTVDATQLAGSGRRKGPHRCVFKTFVDQVPTNTLGDTQQHQNQTGSHHTQLLANARVSEIQFEMLKTADVPKLSHLEITHRSFYEQNKQEPIPWGLLDRRLGVNSKDATCTTCNKSIVECIGHFGHISLELPVFHIGFVKEITRVLQTICKTCSRVLLPHEDFRQYYLSKMANPESRRVSSSLREEITDMAKRCKMCTYCGSRNGSIKKLPGMLKLIHDLREKESKKDRDFKAERDRKIKEAAKIRRKAKARGQNVDDAMSEHVIEEEIIAGSFPSDSRFRGVPAVSWKEQFTQSLENACKFNPILEDYIDKALLEISPLLALKLFSAIPDEDCYLLNLDPAVGRPEEMIVTQLTVPPVCIRPSVAMGSSGSNEDDLTVKLGDIVYINNFISSCFKKGMPTSVIIENWDYLQQQVAMLVNSDLPGFNKAALAVKPIRAITQRLKGKTGRFRGNLSGKRVDFSSRTVISPDPNLRIDQVGVPDRVAKVLTFPERVFSHNIEELRRAVLNGPDIHPGANIVEFQTGVKIFLKFGDRSKVAAMLREGDVVERHLRDNDVVLFNRQPSLHKMSIMAHRAKVLKWRTFRFNECVCTPYNADFDGDEMNLHLPQTHEARTEAEQLMGVMHNLVTPRHGEPLVAATQDFITSAFLITSKNHFFQRTKFAQIVCGMGDANEPVLVPPPAIMKPVQLWTGKQAFSLLLKPNDDPSQHWPAITVELKARNNTIPDCMDAGDGYVVVRNSELMCGFIDKDALGGSKKGMYYQIIRGHRGSEAAARFLNRLSKCSSRYIGSQGFSIGIDDVTPSERLTQLKQSLVDHGYAKCQEYIEDFNQGKLQLRPGCNEEQTLESLLLGELSSIREDAGSACFKELDLLYNSPLIMAISGSKGSKINISQMTACVGQQAISGSRIPNGFHLRSLPHFPKYSRDPDAKGFVANSFYTGLTATEFFAHTMGGREGLVDTAVKTAETGYMQRRLMKALEDLAVQYDGSVRTSEKNIVQFRYGDDGLDPVLMAHGHLPVNYSLFYEQVRSIFSDATARNKPSTEFTSTVVNAAGGASGMIDWVTEAQVAAGLPALEVPMSEEENTITGDATVLFPAYIEAAVKYFVSHEAITKLCSEKFIEGLMEFMSKEVGELVALLDQLNCDFIYPENILSLPNFVKTRATLVDTPSLCREDAIRIVLQAQPVYKNMMNIYLNGCLTKYTTSVIEPGTAVGAIGSQSIGEPGTQMTLKTFHFAGVASMNITLGVPRIKEIINASKKINTPIITAPLECDTDVKSARIVKGRIETTKLGEICKSIEAVLRAGDCHVRVILDTSAIEDLQLNITTAKVVAALDGAKGLKLKGCVKSINHQTIVISPPAALLAAGSSTASTARTAASSVLQALQSLKHSIAQVVVEGIPTVSRAVINDDGNGKYNLLVEGYDLLSVMTTMGVLGNKATSNHIIEVYNVLGIEAARATIIHEIDTTMGSHGLTVDMRHSSLLADIMTYQGNVHGITRFGIAKMKESVLMLASFEKTADHLFEAALRGSKDSISGVSECIILGSPMPVGTGLFSLVQSVKPTSMPSYSEYETAFKKNAKQGITAGSAAVETVLTNREARKTKDQNAMKDTTSKKVSFAVPDIVERQRPQLSDTFALRRPLISKFISGTN